MVAAKARVNMGILRLNATAVLTLPCGVDARNEPVATVTLKVDTLDVDTVSIYDVEVVASVYNRPKQGFSLVGSIKGKVRAEFAAAAADLGAPAWIDAGANRGMLRRRQHRPVPVPVPVGDGNGDGDTAAAAAAAAAELGGFGELDAEASFTFDTFRNTFRAAMDVSLTVGPLDVRLTAGISSANDCDMDNGDYLTGNATLAFSDTTLIAGISGVDVTTATHPTA